MGLMSIRQVACGENHTLALVDMVVVEEDQIKEDPVITTKMFVWGSNDKRQLGMMTEPISPISCVESTSAGNADCLSSGPTGGPGSATTINQDLKVPH